jgi:tryptophan halogenase
MNDDESLKSILIVGGGTAGWMAAALLNRFLRPTGCAITLVESSDIGTIGVGEATVPPLVKFVRVMDFDEDEFMRRCGATYKLGIRFLEWVRDGHAYWHPFGVCGGMIDGIDLFHFWSKSKRAGRDIGAYSSYSLQALLGETGKAPRPVRGSSPIMKAGAYAYHIDASRLAAFLSEIATGEGVTHLFDDVRQVTLDHTGAIAGLDTVGGRSLSADLYIDCTGFAAVLIEDGLGDPWIDWSHFLFCDRAVVVPLPREEQVPPYTRATALKAGWMWQIPLSHRLGCGYVYSSSHTDDHDAVRELLARTSSTGPGATDYRQLKMRVGRRRNFWAKNCVSVGLASGFLEPLESTGIYFIQRSLELLLEYLPDRTFNQALVQAYNKRVATIFEEVRDFILLHYLLNRRDDNAFWRDSRNVPVPDSLQAVIELHDETGMVEAGRVTLFQEPSLHFIFCGGERLPRRSLNATEFADVDRACKVLAEIRQQNLGLAEKLPTHQALMKSLHGSDS